VRSRRRKAVDGPRACSAAAPYALGALAFWLVTGLAVQRWASWEEGIQEQFAADTRAYETIARAAPSLPDGLLLRPFAERFPVHWLVGAVADATGAGLHSLYRGAQLVCLALMLVVVFEVLSTLRLSAGEQLLALGVLAASAYPVHYLLAAPGMLSDGVFLLGLSLSLLGFVLGSFGLVLGGLVLGVLGRQTGVPVAFAAAIWVAMAPAWRPTRWLRAGAVALVPLALWLALHLAADGFAESQRGGIHDLTGIGFLSDLGDVSAHLGRVLLGILVPGALVAGAWLRTRGDVPRGALLLAAAVAVQPLVLGPTSTGGNETRLAALAVPALAVAAGALLRGAQLRTWETALLAAAIFVAGLHHRYTHVGLDRPAWLAAEIAGSAVIVAVLARPVAAELVAARGRTA
jgi:hypothetical protein